jgi:hypothetical protein
VPCQAKGCDLITALFLRIRLVGATGGRSARLGRMLPLPTRKKDKGGLTPFGAPPARCGARCRSSRRYQ